MDCWSIFRLRLTCRNIADLLLVPQDAGSYPAVIFNHGTSLMATDYKDLLSHVASHGYIVMAPQIYNPLAVVTTSVGVH